MCIYCTSTNKIIRHLPNAVFLNAYGPTEATVIATCDEVVFLKERTRPTIGRPIRVNAYVVVNGSLEPPDERVEDKFLSYLFRAVSVFSDEILRDSLVEAVDFAAARPAWTLRGIIPSVDASVCAFDDAPILTFDACLTELLFDEGARIGRDGAIPWLSAAELRAVALEY